MNNWPTLVLAGAGAVLIAAGIALRRGELAVTEWPNVTGGDAL